MSPAEVCAAAHEAQCDELVQQLPHRYETVDYVVHLSVSVLFSATICSMQV
jgi:hypothetical protein